MKKHLGLTFIFVVVLLSTGCSGVQEVAKTLWGSSTRVLNKERANGISKTYSCRYESCYDTVRQLGENRTLGEATYPKKFLVFLEDKTKNHMIIMNIPGSVDTTEVGVFFTKISGDKVKIELSSLSSHAKRKASYIIFEELDKYYSEVVDD